MMMGSRRIGVTRRSVSGIYSFRGAVGVPFESTLERDFVMRAELDPCVSEVLSQPVTVTYLHVNGRAYPYTPDYLVSFINDANGRIRRPLLVEVKPEAEWRKHWREWSFKWKAAARLARSEGWSFRVMDEGRIRDQRFNNICWVRRYRNWDFGGPAVDAALAAVGDRGPMSVSELAALVNRVYPGIDAVALIWAMVASLSLVCDMDVALTLDSIVQAPNVA